MQGRRCQTNQFDYVLKRRATTYPMVASAQRESETHTCGREWWDPYHPQVAPADWEVELGRLPDTISRSDSHGHLRALLRPMSVTDCLSSANDLLAAHASLISRVRTSQKYHRRQLAALPSPPQSLLKLDLLPSPPPSPSISPLGSPLLQPKQRVVRPDLPPAKKARVAKYQNYVPEEETIRNDYSQRYVDGGEWPQDWVLGADPARRFEE